MDEIAHGIDLVDCSRIRQMLRRHGERFLRRIFTAAERSYAESNRNKVEKLAGRFAAKEAILKLLGTGWRGSIAWTDMEITNSPSGQPKVKLSGRVAEIARQKGIGPISVSITHTADFAIASVVAAAGLRPRPLPLSPQRG